MSQIAVRLTNEELRRLDAVVDGGGFQSRAEAVRAAIGLLDEAVRERRIANSYRAAYGAAALTADEEVALDAALILAAEVAP